MAATPYPSTIDVAGVTGGAGKVTVRLNAFSHTYPGDVKVMLVSPSGTAVMLMAYGGGGTAAVSTDLTFDDAGSTNFTPSVSGTYHPIDNSGGGAFGDPFPAPAPSAYYTELAAFVGNPANGTWSLYVVDDGAGDVGTIDGGWTLNITPVVYSNAATAGPDLAVGMTASTAVVASGQQIVYTITVANNGTADATDVQFSDTFPAGLTPTGGSITQGFGSIDGNDVIAFFGTIPAKGFATVILQATAGAAGSFSNTASVTTTAADIDLTNNSATLGGVIGVPNLTLVQPAGWSDRLVVSSVPGTNTDSIAAGVPLYLDFAVGNTGTAAASAYFTMQVFVDGVLARTIQRQLALAVNGVDRVEDVLIPPLSAGAHAIRVLVDSGGVIGESDKTDNDYTRLIGYAAPTLAAFAPAQMLEDGVLARVALSVGTGGIAPGNLAFSASSSNPALVPNANVTFGSDANGSFFSVTPLPDANGYATITITVTASDGSKASADLALTVLSVNDAPTLAALPNLDLHGGRPAANRGAHRHHGGRRRNADPHGHRRLRQPRPDRQPADHVPLARCRRHAHLHPASRCVRQRHHHRHGAGQRRHGEWRRGLRAAQLHRECRAGERPADAQRDRQRDGARARRLADDHAHRHQPRSGRIGPAHDHRRLEQPPVGARSRDRVLSRAKTRRV